MKSIVIIPSRLSSERLPNKPLMKINGKTMIVHTLEKVLASGLKPVVVATDSKEIFNEVVKVSDARAIMTSSGHTCGTERVLEAYENLRPELGDFDLIINVQGDEPFIDPKMLSELVVELEQRQNLASFWTTVCEIPEHELNDQNVAKVVTNLKGNALVFTRDPICKAYKHTSIYIYTPEFLRKFCSLPQSPLETAYRLEQMRALDHNLTLNCILLPYDSISINTKEDLEKAGITDYHYYYSPEN
jgi:3-deoxy-manno-octulosonate cytidylyltransferase (CMP-KDO synthetase)